MQIDRLKCRLPCVLGPIYWLLPLCCNRSLGELVAQPLQKVVSAPACYAHARANLQGYSPLCCLGLGNRSSCHVFALFNSLYMVRRDVQRLEQGLTITCHLSCSLCMGRRASSRTRHPAQRALLLGTSANFFTGCKQSPEASAKDHGCCRLLIRRVDHCDRNAHPSSLVWQRGCAVSSSRRAGHCSWR